MTRKRKYKRVNQSANETHSYQDDAFQLLLARFDRVDRDNKDILTKFSKHLEDDAAVSKKVEKHSTYWSLLLWFGTPLALGAIGLAGKHLFGL